MKLIFFQIFIYWFGCATLYSGFFLLQSRGSRLMGFSKCGAQTQSLWHTGLAALQHTESSQTRDRTHVACIGRQILIHCSTQEILKLQFEEHNRVYILLRNGMYEAFCVCHLQIMLDT